MTNTVRNSQVRGWRYWGFGIRAWRIEGEEDGEISEEESENEAVNEEPQPVITLFHAYKEAIVEGDLHKISDIETKLYAIETEKNALEQQITSLSAELSSGKEKFLWLKADFENFRKRSEKDRLTLTSDVQGDVIESLLPMVDNFERAKQQLKPETEKEKKIDGSYQGIYKQFVEIMRSLKVAVVETVGKPFDPSLHEAIAREESVEYKEGIIIQEFRRGFVLGDRLLRPAMVKVSAGPGPRKPSPGSPKPKPTEQLGGVQDSSVSPQPSEVGNI
ncbi:hypothetical protein AMTR_s00017p00181540 [Amborella trichopoda]|uniref:GrpE protein homolog n=1 Tax=Amborella trichopoda TaxID=13333 RepID=W1PKQ1_AMBTC|nr:hypothetical protein AMTR_s00017p00181540 [Amborella trichopoda]